MTPIEFAALDAGEVREFMRMTLQASHWHLDDRLFEERLPLVDLKRALVARDGARVVGAIGAHSVDLTLPGLRTSHLRALSEAAVTPGHRRRGILRELMVRSLRAAAEQGEALAGLTTSQWALHGRYGFGAATFTASLEVETAFAALVDPAPDRCQSLDVTEAERCIPEVERRVAHTTVGGIDRDDAYWSFHLERLFHNPAVQQRAFALGHETDGRIDGIAAYVVDQQWHEGLPANRLTVRHLCAERPAAARALWAALLELDFIGTVAAPTRPIDEPLRWWLTDGRRVRTTAVGDHLWLRILDLGAALNARDYADCDRVIVRLSDPLRFVGDGAYVLEFGPGGAYCSPSTCTPDLSLGVDRLSSALLGGVSFGGLLRAGVIEEHTADAARRLDHIFRVDPHPYTAMPL